MKGGTWAEVRGALDRRALTSERLRDLTERRTARLNRKPPVKS